MGTTKHQKFTATFKSHNGKASGEITTRAFSFDEASIVIKETLGDKSMWSLMQDESGKEILNSELDDFSPTIDFGN